MAQALRTVRTNVLFSSTSEGGQSIVITSSGPGEGKTVVSTNLALALAQTGQRVLLIDADMRRPRVHQVFSERQEPGLSNVLVGDGGAEQREEDEDRQDDVFELEERAVAIDRDLVRKIF